MCLQNDESNIINCITGLFSTIFLSITIQSLLKYIYTILCMYKAFTPLTSSGNVQIG